MSPVSTKDVRSSAFQELRSYVDTRYHGKHSDFRDMLFAIAYTQYSSEKKTRLGRLEETRENDGKGLTSTDVKNVVVELCHDEEYEKICTRSEEELHQFGDSFSTDVLKGITGVIVDQLKPQKGIGKFLKSSLLHALEIIIAVVMLAIIYQLLVLVMPFLEDTVTKYLGKIIDLLLLGDGS